MSERACPNCSSLLQAHTHEGVPLDRCPEGCGLWLDRGELQLVVERELVDRANEEERAALTAAAADAGHAVLAEAGRAKRPCPVCRSEMAVIEYANSGIPIDSCGAHGTWLDGGELERIEAYAEGFRSRPRADMAAPSPVRGVSIPPEVLATLGAAAPRGVDGTN